MPADSASTLNTVRAFYQAMGDKDWTRVRSVLDDGYKFRGALSSFDGPDEFIAGIQQMPFEGIPEGSRFIVDDERVAHVFRWKMTAPESAEVPMCEVLEVRDGKVLASELFYDSKLFPTPS